MDDTNIIGNMLTYHFFFNIPFYRKNALGTMTHTVHYEIMNFSSYIFCDLH